MLEGDIVGDVGTDDGGRRPGMAMLGEEARRCNVGGYTWSSRSSSPSSSSSSSESSVSGALISDSCLCRRAGFGGTRGFDWGSVSIGMEMGRK